MALPVNIEQLLRKNLVESNRIEFKAGWNPDDILQTICAFANDFEDNGGGYILVGVEQNERGVAIRPVKGLPTEALDGIQKKLVECEAKINPRYFTKTSIEEIDGQKILAIWVPAGLNRPYTVPERVTVKKSPRKHYIRSKSSTIEAKDAILDEVMELRQKLPFDERANETATLEDISRLYLYEHLKKVGSRLKDDFFDRPLEEVLEEMNLLTGPSEDRKLKNVAIMMFCEYPEKFFPYTQVEIVLFPEGLIENPDLMIEVPKITGPVPKIINDTLNYLKTNVIKKKIIKPSDSEYSITYFNYPYQALEEGVVNALYHRLYTEREPVEITVEPEKIEILSHGGPDRSIPEEAIKGGKSMRTRKYRNRRLGEFLKELKLSEGRSTGIPTIQKELKENGSAPATFSTNEERSYFLLSIPCRVGFESEVTSGGVNGESGGVNGGVNSMVNDQSDSVLGEIDPMGGGVSGGVNGGVNLTDRERNLLKYLQENPSHSISTISDSLKIPKRTLERIISKLRENKIIERAGSDKAGTWNVCIPDSL